MQSSISLIKQFCAVKQFCVCSQAFLCNQAVLYAIMQFCVQSTNSVKWFSCFADTNVYSTYVYMLGVPVHFDLDEGGEVIIGEGYKYKIKVIPYYNYTFIILQLTLFRYIWTLKDSAIFF